MFKKQKNVFVHPIIESTIFGNLDVLTVSDIHKSDDPLDWGNEDEEI